MIAEFGLATIFFVLLFWLLISKWHSGRVARDRAEHREENEREKILQGHSIYKPARYFDLSGPGNFAVHVAGTSKYQRELLQICGNKRTKNGRHKKVDAMLVREPSNPFDPHAIRVDIKQTCVGYLPREVLPAFETAVKTAPPDCGFKAKGMVVGGWDNDYSAGSFGVRLDI